MNIEAYDLDSLRKLVRDLQWENKELRELLDKANIPYADSEVFSDIPAMAEEYDPDQGARISRQYIDRNLATQFLQCSGEGQMYLPGGRKMEVIIRSVIIAGRLYVRNKREKNNIVRNV